MTEEEAKQELREYRQNKKTEQQKIERLEELKNDCMRMSSVLSDMPKPPLGNRNKIEEKYVKYLDLQNEVLDLINENLEKNIFITKKIQSIEQPYRNILELRYMDGATLSETADVLNCSISTAIRKFNDAIIKYKEL